MAGKTDEHPACQFQTDKPWLDPQFHKNGTIKKPDELENEMNNPPGDIDRDIFDRIYGSMMGMALGDALGAFVEFRPHEYMVAYPVTELKGGGTWGLKKGQFTDDTSMGLCLANSLVARRDYVPYDQLVRYKWWHQKGYMSSTGSCFDIGSATKQSLVEFERRQKEFAEKYKLTVDELDLLSDPELLNEFKVNCSREGVAGNGALMRLTPVPLFFYRDPSYAVECSGRSGKITHGDQKAYDACRYYGALIVAALHNETREELLHKEFYSNHAEWFDGKPLHPDIMAIAEGSYKKKGGYEKGIRGKGYIVSALEAALWAFWLHKDSFEDGALAAVNLGDDTDTTAAIYGQLAGAYYGYQKLRKDWVKEVYAKNFIKCLSKWIVYEGEQWTLKGQTTLTIPSGTLQSSSKVGATSSSKEKTDSKTRVQPTANQKHASESSKKKQTAQIESAPMSQQSDGPKTHSRPRRYTFDPEASTSQSNLLEQSASARPKSAKPCEHVPDSECIYYPTTVKTCDDVCSWLIQSCGEEYENYVKFFQKYDVDGYWLINQVDNDKLNKYGIQRPDHRQVILDNIKELKKTCPVEFPITPK